MPSASRWPHSPDPTVVVNEMCPGTPPVQALHGPAVVDVVDVVVVVVVVVVGVVIDVVVVELVVTEVVVVTVVVVVVVVVVVGGHEPEAPPGHRLPIISPQLPQTLAPPPQSHVPALQALMTALEHPDFAPPVRPESATSSLQAV